MGLAFSWVQTNAAGGWRFRRTHAFFTSKSNSVAKQKTENKKGGKGLKTLCNGHDSGFMLNCQRHGDV